MTAEERGPARMTGASTTREDVERDALQPVGWIFFNPDTGIELSDQHPIDSGECPDATRIWPATAPTLAEFLKEAWETNRTTEAERDAARAEVERMRGIVDALWGARCDADPLQDVLDNLMEKHGYATWRDVTADDVEAPFAAERGIFLGGSLLELTPEGRAALTGAPRHE